MKEYKTVEFESKDEFVEKKSRFIGYVKPVKTQEEATNFINSIKSKHWDATHNVSAFVLRENNIQRSSDDGEPSGTAGVPTLDVLLKENLVDVCVVVTRYFGGTLLGAGGLIRAYSHSSKIAVDAGHIITMAPCKVLSVSVDYSFYDRLNILLSEFNANIENSEFTDNYIEIPVDLSDVLFITTANSQEQIPDALLDRMEVIRVTSYTDYEKFEIANRYLLPRQLKENGMDKSQFHITRDAIYTIINNYTRESGVRELERNIGKVVRKAVVKIVRDDVKKVVVNNKNLEKFLGSKLVLDDEIPREDTIGVVNGLAWTQVGGVILTIEANVMDGTGKTQLTGKLGDVMKESAMAAISYIRSNQEDLGIKGEFYKEKDIHIHVPEGAVPKDGPSAGVTMVTALVSALTGRKVKHDFAMTGEITLTGRVLAIGGVKEKVLAAHRYGINKVFLPKENKRDIQDIDPKIRQKIKFYFTSNVKEILDEVLI